MKNLSFLNKFLGLQLKLQRQLSSNSLNASTVGDVFMNLFHCALF